MENKPTKVLDRRRFLVLAGSATVVGAGAVVASKQIFAPEAGAIPDCILTDGSIGGDRQRTLEAAANVMLPGGGTHGTTGDGILNALLYDKGIYAHLIDPYYAIQIKQSDLDAAVTDLSNGAICMGNLSGHYWKLGCNDQLGLMAYGTKRSDEGAAPYVDFWEGLCLAFGQLFAPTISDPAKAYDMSRFCGLIFYSSDAGLAYLKTYAGYPGPSSGYRI
jgi:hypothetical protein